MYALDFRFPSVCISRNDEQPPNLIAVKPSPFLVLFLILSLNLLCQTRAGDPVNKESEGSADTARKEL